MRSKFVKLLGRYKTALQPTAVVSRRYVTDVNRYAVTSSHTVNIPKVPLHEFMYENILRFPDKISVECGISGRQYTFEQVRVLSRRIASFLQNKFGLQKGDRVALVLPNVPEYPLIFLGSSETGLHITTLNSKSKSVELAQQLNHCKVKVIFTIPEKYLYISEALTQNGAEVPIVVVKQSQDDEIPRGAVNFEELLSASLPEPSPVEVTPEDTLVLPWSSGTTGVPKAVELTHSNIVSNLCQMNHPSFNLLRESTANFQDCHIGVLPLFHIYGMVLVMLSGLKNGSKLITLPSFDPNTFLHSINQHKCSVLHIVPPLVLYLGGDEVSKVELKNARTIITGAAPCGETDILRLKEKLRVGSHVIQAHGLTESSPLVFIPQQSRYGKKLNSVGSPLPLTKIRIADPDTNANRPVNRVGEILISGPQIMKGYLDNEEATMSTIDEHGWLRTGDLAYFDEDGEFFIVDRIKELIKVKGFQVAPAELEEILRSHPKIKDAGVIAVADARSGEVPKACVVAKSSVTEKEIQEFVAKQVSYYKELAGGVQFVNEIPKSVSGKIIRRELRALYS